MTPGTSHTLVGTLLASDPGTSREFRRQLLADVCAPDVRIRWRAVFELACLGDPGADALPALIAAALGDEDPGVRTHAARALTGGGRDAAEALFATLAEGGDHDAVLELLGGLGAEAVAVLANALSAEEPATRWAAAGALEDLATEDATEALIAALSDPDDEVRHCAATALGHVGAPAVGALLATLGDRLPMARAEAARALGYLADPSAFMPLIVALDDPDPGVRGSAAWALGCLRDPRALVPLLVALDDADHRVREGAAAGLGRSGDGRSVRPLIGVLEDVDDNVRCRAAAALGELGGRRALPFLIAALTCDPCEDVRWAASDAIAEIGTEAVAPLLEALDGEDEEARGWIALALETLGASAIESSVDDAHGHDRRLGPAHVREALSWTDEGRAAAM